MNRRKRGSGETPAQHYEGVAGPAAHVGDVRARLELFAQTRYEGQTCLDEGGVEASRFGAATSGQAILYDGDGRLVFSGGITAARGHFGDNAGSQALARLLIDGMPSRPHTPVFGCALFDRAMRCAQGGDACRS